MKLVVLYYKIQNNVTENDIKEVLSVIETAKQYLKKYNINE